MIPFSEKRAASILARYDDMLRRAFPDIPDTHLAAARPIGCRRNVYLSVHLTETRPGEEYPPWFLERFRLWEVYFPWRVNRWFRRIRAEAKAPQGASK